MSHQRLHVGVGQAYDVWVGDEADLLARALGAAGASRASKSLLLTDRNVEAAGHADRVSEVLAALGVEVMRLVVSPGEEAKSLSVYHGLLERMAGAGLDRQAWVFALGGGVVGDLAGFLAASYLRGLNWAQLPTSLLAMVDASVGGKTGLNLAAGKNLVGAFWQPRVVVAEVAALASLPEAELRGGAMEMYKHALLVDAPWRREAFHRPGEAAGLRHELPTASWVDLVSANVEVKADVVGRDERESGVRAHLNLGHTLAHALETVTAHRMSHGTAVAYGLVYAALLGQARGWVDWRADVQAVAAWAADQPLPDLPFAELLSAMRQDKKRQDGRLRFVLLREAGRPELVNDVSEQELGAAWSTLLDLFHGGNA